MRFIWFLTPVLLLATACGSSEEAESDSSVEYLAKGAFSNEPGAMNVTAQLALEESGEYTWLYLEPLPMALQGAETGRWTANGQGLLLMPVPEEGEPDSEFARRSAEQTADAEPKQLIAVGDAYTWTDGTLQLTFEPSDP